MAKIIIIGAGIAGLNAALTLAQAKHEVILLEARNRTGGRVYTQQQDVPVELGASYWEGTKKNPFYQRYFNAKNPNQPCTQRLDETQSQLIAIDHLTNGPIPFKTWFPLYQQACTLLQQNPPGQTCEAFILEAVSKLAPDRRYWVKKFMENQLQHHCTPLKARGFPTFTLPQPTEDEAWDDENADFCFVKKGYSQVTAQIEKACLAKGVKLMLNTPVTQIINQKNTILIKADKKTFKADKAISTLPIGVLKKQTALFDPDLPFEKKEAIKTIGVHENTRVILTFKTPFWGKGQGPYLWLDAPYYVGFKEFRNNYPLYQKATLQTEKYSDVAEKLYQQYPLKQAETKLVQVILTDLEKAFPHCSIPPPSVTIYSWSRDPFAQGAYPYRSAKMTEQKQRALSAPFKNLYFAGADFSRWGFSVHNAFASGKKVAKQLLKEL